jgi:hypothetical protein
MLGIVKWIINRVDNDPVQWSWAFDGWSATPSMDGELSGMTDAMLAAWDTIVDDGRFPPLSMVRAELVFPTVNGAAVSIYNLAAPHVLGTSVTWGPEEVAACVTEHVAGPRGPRPLGRTYYGPFAAGTAANRRPPDALLDELRQFAVAVHGLAVGAPYDLTPVVVSRFLNKIERADPVGLPIVQYSTDDAWDTQRRRGNEPTAREYSGLL